MEDDQLVFNCIDQQVLKKPVKLDCKTFKCTLVYIKSVTERVTVSHVVKMSAKCYNNLDAEFQQTFQTVIVNVQTMFCKCNCHGTRCSSKDLHTMYKSTNCVLFIQHHSDENNQPCHQVPYIKL